MEAHSLAQQDLEAQLAALQQERQQRIAALDDINHQIEAVMAQLADAKGQSIRGLGDVVASTTKLLSLKPCSACQKRQAWLNKAVPF